MNFNNFPINKYTKWYIALIEKNRYQDKQTGLTEKHHIFPKSIFGNNEILVNLTHKQHYIAHLLLWKMFLHTKHYPKAMFALLSMKNMKSRCNGRTNLVGGMNSRIFQSLRSEASKFRSEMSKQCWADPETRAKLVKHRQEYWGNEDNRKKQSGKRKEYFESNPEAKDAIGVFFKELYATDEWKAKLADKDRLNKSFHSEEARRKANATLSTKEVKDKIRRTINERYTKEERKQAASKGGKANAAKHTFDELSAINMGRKYYVNMNTMERRNFKEGDATEGWVLWSELTDAQKKMFPKKSYDAGAGNRGTVWITNGIVSKKIKKDERVPNGWIKGRKMTLMGESELC